MLKRLRKPQTSQLNIVFMNTCTHKYTQEICIHITGGGGGGGGGRESGGGDEGWEEGRESFHRFHLSPRLYPSTAGRSPPSMSSIVFCLLLSCSRWFPPPLLCLAIFCLVVLLISSLSLVATLCSVWPTDCPSFLLHVRPISTFVSVRIL